MSAGTIGSVDLMVDRHVRSGRGSHAALVEVSVDGDRRSLSYLRLQRETEAIAEQLAVRAQGRELRIAIVGSATLETVAWWLGAMRGGHLVFLVNPDLPAAQYPPMLGTFRPDVLLGDRTASNLDCEPMTLGQATVAEATVAGAYFPEAHLPENDSRHTEDARPALVLASSGSTGRPKLCVHAHRAFWGFERYVSRAVWGMNAGDRVLASGGPFFSFGLQGIHPPLSVGATAVLLPQWREHGDFLKVIEAECVSVFLAVPTLYHLLQSRTDAALLQRRTRSLRVAMSAGEHLPAIVRRRWETHTGVPMCDSIGTTETFVPYLSETVEGGSGNGLRDVGCFDYEMRFTETAGHGGDTVFMAVIKSAYMMLGYLGDDGRLMRSKDRFLTHDLFMLKQSGWHFVSRRSERVKVSGLWVSPQELEEFLLQDERVLKAAALPLETDEGLQRLRAFVVLRPEESGGQERVAGQLLARAREMLRPKALCPDKVCVVEDLKASPTGKFKRTEFRTTVQSLLQGSSGFNAEAFS